MPDPGIVLIAILVAGAAGFVLFRVFSPSGKPVPNEDRYLEALEAWVDGRTSVAETILREVIHRDTRASAPYLQLGNLLRETGRADKGAVMHRALMARSDLSRSQRVQAGLSLAEDLLQLERFREAGLVLDDLVRHVGDRPAYWRARFRQWWGLGDAAEAAKALKFAAEHVPTGARDTFRHDHAAFQLDRAYAAALDGDEGTAQRCLKSLPKGQPLENFASLATAVLAAGKGRIDQALDTAAADLAGVPAAVLAFQDSIRPILLESNRFERSLPMLERVVQDASAPVELVVELALLYDKTGRRDQALDLIAGKGHRPDLTPDAVAPFLTALIRDGRDHELQRLWRALRQPRRDRTWRCGACGHGSPRFGLFCPHCFAFGPLTSNPEGA